MARFKVKSNISKDGKTYRAGDVIELEKDEARLVADALENPPKPETHGDKDLAAALKSQTDRPDPWSADWKVDAATRDQRQRDREKKDHDVEKTSEEVNAEGRENFPPQTAAPGTAVTTQTTEPGAGGTDHPAGDDKKHVADDKKKAADDKKK